MKPQCHVSWKKMLPFSVFMLAACETAHTPDSTALPTCEQLAEILRVANKEFNAIRTGPKIYVRTSSLGYWNTTKVLARADYCRIREGIPGIWYECAWPHSSPAEMGAHYQALRDRVVSCVGDVTVRRDDLRGRSTIELLAPQELSRLRYAVIAEYRSPPYRVIFRVETMK